MKELEVIRNRVYQQRIDIFHWDLSTIFEMNGDYVTEDQVQRISVQETVAGTEYDYAPGSFVVVKTRPNESSRFWIAQVLSVKIRNTEQRPQDLEIVWYSPRSGYEDEFVARYDIARIYDRRAKRHTRYEDVVNVSTIMVHFECLTHAKFLSANTQRSIRQALHLQ